MPVSDELVADPGFERSLAGWEIDSGSAMARMPWSHSGQYGALIVRTASGRAPIRVARRPNFDISSTGRCTASMWIAGSPGLTAKLRLREYRQGQRTGNESTELTLVPGWNLLQVDISGTREDQLALDLSFADAASLQGVLLDDVSVTCH